MTTWKSISGFETYEVSDDGNVRNTKTGRILKPSINPYGYRVVALGYGNTKQVSRLMAGAFLHKPNGEKLEVAHNDGVRHNDTIDNLRWATKTENQRDRYKHGTHSVGEKAANAKLTNEQVRYIRSSFVKKYGAVAKLSREYGLSNQAMWKICHGLTYKELP